MPKTVETQQTLRDLRDCFRKWDLELWEAIPLDSRRGIGGMALRYFRAGTWQEIRCESYLTKSQNLRQCFLPIDRLRLAEKSGVTYSGLTSSKELTKVDSKVMAKEEEEDAYGILGVAPDDTLELIKGVYKRKAEFYHPDKPGGDAEKFKRISAAYEKICETRGVRP